MPPSACLLSLYIQQVLGWSALKTGVSSQQIGCAVGVSILSAIATTHTSDLLKTGTALPFALTSGFRAAFAVAAVLTLVGVVVTLVVIRRSDVEVAAAAEPPLETA